MAEGFLTELFNAVTLAGGAELDAGSALSRASFPFEDHLMTSRGLLHSAVLPAVPTIPDSGASAE